MIQRFTELDKSRQNDLLQQIVLEPSYFQNLESNPLPLKLFRDLFIEGATWDVSQLIPVKDGPDSGSYKYVWLFATFLNFKHLMSLSNYFDLKKQLVIFVETEVMPALIAFAAQGDHDENSFVVQLCAEMARRAGLLQGSAEAAISYEHTLEFLVSKMSDPGEDFPAEFKPVLKVDEFKHIFKQVCAGTCEALLKGNFKADVNLSSVDIAIKILKQTAYYLLDEDLIMNLYKLCKSNLQALTDTSSAPLLK